MYWRLCTEFVMDTLKFNLQKFPETEVMRCPGKEAIESHFMSAVKEVTVK